MEKITKLQSLSNCLIQLKNLKPSTVLCFDLLIFQINAVVQIRLQVCCRTSYTYRGKAITNFFTFSWLNFSDNVPTLQSIVLYCTCVRQATKLRFAPKLNEKTKADLLLQFARPETPRVVTKNQARRRRSNHTINCQTAAPSYCSVVPGPLHLPSYTG